MTDWPVLVDGKTWGARVRDRREALNLTQAQLADLCGLEQQTISKIERDQIRPRDRTKQVIAARTGTPIGELFPWPVRVAS